MKISIGIEVRVQEYKHLVLQIDNEHEPMLMKDYWKNKAKTYTLKLNHISSKKFKSHYIAGLLSVHRKCKTKNKCKDEKPYLTNEACRQNWHR